MNRNTKAMKNAAIQTRSSRREIRRALTLIEVLIATTLTLLMMLALAQGFKTLSDGVSEGRAKINLSDQLRGIVTLLKADLEQRTTDGTTPQPQVAPRGYFKYLDGGLTDFTATNFNRPAGYNRTIDPEILLGASKWGDVDDVLMFTARAKPGEVFRGKIPRALLRYHEFNTTGTISPAVTNWDEEWATDVVITSELAEIIWFMVPLSNLPDGNGLDSGVVAPSDIWPDVIPVVDRNGDGIPDADGMPDKMALCRRVLLIRDDLDITPPNIGSEQVAPSAPEGRLFRMRPDTPSVGNPNSFRNVGANAYKRCDLSLRTELVSTSSGNQLVYQTNSLSSLQDPMNRFAHGVYPVSDGSNVVGSTFPLVFRSNGLEMSLGVYNAGIGLAGAPAETVEPDGGFIPANFMRIRYLKTTDGSLVAPPTLDFTLEEVVATNVVSFDLRAFDPTAVQVYHPGRDNGWGTAGFDDDVDTTLDNVTEAGWPASDDIALTPCDPGFWEVANNFARNGVAMVEASRGAYVDMGWGIKGVGNPKLAGANLTTLAPFIVSDYSGIEATNQISYYMLRSGSVSVSPGVRVFQTAFDTFTDKYDSDGEEAGVVANTRYYPQGLRKFGITVPVRPTDPTIEDVPPPFTADLKSIQANIRVEDITAGVIQQVSLIESLKD